MLKLRTQEVAEVDITPMIDIVFQLIIFFMVVMAIAVVYGVAIKFPPPGQKGKKPEKEEKNLVVYVQADHITEGHVIIKDGVLKLNGEEIPLTRADAAQYEGRWEELYLKWAEEREEAYDDLQTRMEKLIVDRGYKTEVLFIQGDMKTYHGKIMRVIDRGKRVKTGETEPDEYGNVRDKIGIDGFSLVPPQR